MWGYANISELMHGGAPTFLRDGHRANHHQVHLHHGVQAHGHAELLHALQTGRNRQTTRMQSHATRDTNVGLVLPELRSGL